MAFRIVAVSLCARETRTPLSAKEKRRSLAPQNDIDDDSDINIDMGADVDSVVIDVTVVTKTI